MRTIPLLLLLWSGAVPADRYDAMVTPSLERFPVCHDHSCGSVVTTYVTPTEWSSVTHPLRDHLPDAVAERRAVARYIARMEDLVGYKTATGNDRGGNFRGMFMPGQMDCIDESTNTTTYLKLLEQQGLLRHHTVLDRVTRFGIFAGMPHTTAVLGDTDGERYAVDSWFFDNGSEPAIVRLDEWKAGWRPPRDRHD